MKIIVQTILPILLILVPLTSCNGSPSPSQPSPTKALETAVSNAWTNVAETQIAIPTATPTLKLPGPYFTSIPPEADEQVYVDPAGWYSVTLPVDMKPGDKPNSFMGQGRLLETGYLPYMTQRTSLCMWVANVELEPERSTINWVPPCTVTGSTGVWYSVDYRIYENPLADHEHRFVYIKMGRTYQNLHAPIEHTVTWLKPPSQTNLGTGPLTPEEASFWANPDTALNGASIVEYVLPPAAQAGPYHEMLMQFVPEEAQPDWEALRKKASSLPKEPAVEEQLKPLGYELKVVETQPRYRQQLLRDGRLLFDYVFSVSKVHKFSTDSGPITAFVVTTAHYGGDFNSFLVVNDAIHAWDYAPSDTANFAPILYQGDLLWATGTQDSRVEIRRNNREILFTFETYFATHLAVNSFRAWNGHWILTAGDFLVQDGEILNQKLGFPEIFAWHLVDNRPAFLFRKGSRLGLSYDGKVLLLPYQDIPRGLCCGLGINNPGFIDGVMRLFGQRDGVWYYAVVKFK